jgi:hypothetical protein
LRVSFLFALPFVKGWIVSWLTKSAVLMDCLYILPQTVKSGNTERSGLDRQPDHLALLLVGDRLNHLLQPLLHRSKQNLAPSLFWAREDVVPHLMHTVLFVKRALVHVYQ